MSKNSWATLPEVSELTDGKIMVGWTGLPANFDLERFELNVGAVQRGAINWGGYSAVKLAAYRGDEDSYSMGVGTDSSGNAYGVGSVAVSKAESSSHQSESDEELNGLNIRNGVLNVGWNITALDSKLDLADRFDPQKRAKQLDNVIRRQLFAGVFEHNTIDVIRTNKDLVPLLYDATFFPMLAINISLQTVSYHYYGLRVLIAGLSRANDFVQARVNDPQSVCWRDTITDPYFASCRPLKALAAAGSIATSRFVRSH